MLQSFDNNDNSETGAGDCVGSFLDDDTVFLRDASISGDSIHAIFSFETVCSTLLPFLFDDIANVSGANLSDSSDDNSGNCNEIYNAHADAVADSDSNDNAVGFISNGADSFDSDGDGFPFPISSS